MSAVRQPPRRDRGARARSAWIVALAMSIVALHITGCSSLVDGPCGDGYRFQGDRCVEALGPDASGTVDAGIPDGVIAVTDVAPPGDGPSDGTVGDGGTSDGSAGDGAIDGGVPSDGPVADGAVPDGGPVDGAVDGGVPSDGQVVDGALDGGVPSDGPVADGGVPTDGPVSPDAPACSAPSLTCGGICTDVTTDADHCGACGRRCASGICQASQCTGDLVGHVIAIGHDYRSHNAAMARVLGNAAALAGASDLGIARLAGTAATASKDGVTAALASSLATIGRASHTVALPAEGQPLTGIDVLIIDAQTGDGDSAQALGAVWASAIDDLLARAGVVIVIEGASGVSHRFASGANLFSVATPVETTGSPAFVSAANDAIVQQVVSPYLADTTSVVFPSVVGAIATPSGTVVMHLTR